MLHEKYEVFSTKTDLSYLISEKMKQCSDFIGRLSYKYTAGVYKILVFFFQTRAQFWNRMHHIVDTFDFANVNIPILDANIWVF